MTILQRLACLGLSLLGLAAPAIAASGPEALAPLIQLQGSEFVCSQSEPELGGEVCVKGTSRERMVSIFQNGRAVAITTAGGYDAAASPVTAPAASPVRDGSLRPRDLTALAAFLGGIAIQNRRGGCNPFADLPGFAARGSGASYTVFWYSPDGRRTTVSFGTEFVRRCPAEILGLFNRLVQSGNAIQPR